MSHSRWNSTPLSRTESSVKRSSPEKSDAEDDDVSVASHSPSPPTEIPMDVDHDMHGIPKFHEYCHGTPREEITVATKIKPTNKGFAMLAKLGWSEGQPLGISADGRIDPIPFQVKRDLTGLGKTNQDFRMIETTVSQRRGLDSERQHKETDHQRRAREDLVARKAALENEISSTLKAFYCTLCDKQFKNVAQYDEHTNSYAHHHKARFKDMKANVRLKPQDEIDKRKEKERKREEKELRKIAAANGIKMVKPNPPVVADPTILATPAQAEFDTARPGKTTWTTVSSAGDPTQAPPKAGWAAVGSSPLPALDSSASTCSSSTSTENLHPRKLSAPPAFRTAGWTSLDTGGLQLINPHTHSLNVTRFDALVSKDEGSGPGASPVPSLPQPQLYSPGQPPSVPSTPLPSLPGTPQPSHSWQQFRKSAVGRR